MGYGLTVLGVGVHVWPEQVNGGRVGGFIMSSAVVDGIPGLGDLNDKRFNGDNGCWMV